MSEIDPHRASPSDPAPAPRADEDACSRRAMLRLASGLGVAAFVALSGCSGRKTIGSHGMGVGVGSPIPPDPVLRHPTGTGATPVRRPVGPSASPALPQVMRRTAWAKGNPKPWLADRMGTITRITVHHDAIDPPPSGDARASAERLESIRRGHLGHGWADIGYHFAIDPAGRVWEGRPLDLQGAHVKDQNPHNLGIMVMGNYEKSSPTFHARVALRDTLVWAMRSNGVRLDMVRTHRELAPTACPGRNLQSVMDSMRSDGSLRV